MKRYTHLTEAERETIFLFLNQGTSCRDIGKILGRSYRTIGREIQRNNEGEDSEALKYSPSQADKLAIQRRSLSKRKKLSCPVLKKYVVSKLTHGWSPEEIAGRLKLKVPQLSLSHETIYKFIYDKESKSGRYFEFLRRGHKRRQKQESRRSQASIKLAIPGRVAISQREKEANDRVSFGHFETDLMEGKRITKDAVSVTVDRKTGTIFLDKLINKESEGRIKVLIDRFSRFPGSLIKTMTFDNGKENHDHLRLMEELGCKTYFCNPYHAWEKGTVENTIGLIRNYVPKGTDLSLVTQADLSMIALELNERPRKRLGFHTPSEVVLKETGWVT